MTMKKEKLTAAVLAAAMLAGLAGCGGAEEETESSAVLVEVENPTVGDLEKETEYIGAVTPEEMIYVVPMVSGTVTSVNYSVGDTVEEGDVLFTIDDEVAQLTLASAQATYDSAVAAMELATGSSRYLQDYQTLEGIEEMEDTIDDLDDTIDDLEDQLDELEAQEESLTTALSAAQSAVDAQSGVVTVAEQTLASLESELAVLESATTKDESAIESKELEIQTQELVVAEAKLKLTELQAARDEASSGLTSVQSGISSVESAIDTADDSKDSLEDSYDTTVETYSITVNEVYPDTDATYEAQVDAAQVAVDSALLQLDYYTVEAPISGTVESVGVEVNQLTSSGSSAFVISNKDSMTVTFNVTEAAKDMFEIGDSVTVERNGTTYAGQISEIGTAAGSTTGLFQIKATVYGAGDELPSGVTVKVYAVTEKEEDVLIIPYDALYFSAGDAYVYCVEDGVLVKTAVTVGLMTEDEAVIEEGLDEDSRVVTTWSSKLRDGAEAQISGEETEEETAEEETDAPADEEEEAE